MGLCKNRNSDWWAGWDAAIEECATGRPREEIKHRHIVPDPPGDLEVRIGPSLKGDVVATIQCMTGPTILTVTTKRDPNPHEVKLMPGAMMELSL